MTNQEDEDRGIAKINMVQEIRKKGLSDKATEWIEMHQIHIKSLLSKDRDNK
jgi:hypothetical protein